MIFEEITEDILNEKLITYGNRKPYGQIVFIAGGAGSGKGFAISNFIDSASFKIRDVDEMKKQLQILNRLGKLDINSIIKKYGKSIKPKDIDLINKIQDDGFKLQNLNLKNSDHVYALHILVKAIGIKDASLEKLLLGKNNPETLPNILFDITAKDVTDITSIIPKLKAVGYKPENIHLTWVLTKYVTAIENNKKRERRVPEDIMLKTHEGASNTIWGLITKALPKGMNGRVDVILNNPENTVFLKGTDGKDVEKRQTSSTNKVVKGIDGKQKTIRTTTSKNVKFTSGFLSLPLKKEKGGIYAEKVWKDKLFNWVKSNAPDSITANMKESVNEGKVDRVVGHTRYKYIGDGRKGQAIVSGPMKDIEKEAIIKRAKKAGYSAKPNMGGGVTIHVESVITEKQFKGLDGIDDKTPLTKISDTKKLKIIQSTGNIISFKVPKGSDRNFWQVIVKGKIKKTRNPQGYVRYIVPGKMINSPFFKSEKDLINGVDWDSVEKARRFNEGKSAPYGSGYKKAPLLPTTNDHAGVSEASIKGKNNKTGESFGMVIGSDKKNREGDFEVTVRKTYSSRITSYKFIFDNSSNLIEIADYGYSMDGKFPDMKGSASVKSVKPNPRETITQIAKVTSPAFAKKIYQHVKKVNESVKEASFRPNSGTMSGGTYGLDNRKYQLKRDVKGVQIGDYTNVILPKGTIIYNVPGGIFAHQDVLSAYQSGQNKYFNKPTLKGISIKRTKNTIMAIEKNSKILESVNESMFSMIDLIRQDSKDVRDFVKKVFKDKEFKKMSNDKDFIKYLKSIYEGVVEEAQSPAQKAAFQKMLDKKAGKDESKEEEVNEIAKFVGWVAIDHKGKRLEIKKSEAKDLYNAKLLAIKKLKVPKSKESMLVIKPGYNESVVNEINTSVNKRRAGAELKQKLKGKRSDGMGKYTATIYGLDSKGKRVELKSLNDLNKYSKFELDESVNEGLKHNDMYTMLDIAAGYSSTQDQAANQMWSDEQDLYDYLKSDHIPKKYHKKFHNDIKRRFKNIKESVVNEAKEPEVITQLRKIVKDKQNALVVDTKSKKKVRVDMQSANVMVQVYDALKQQSNKDKFVKSGIVSMGHMAFKLLKKEGVNEAKDEIYFKSYTHAIEAAEVMALKKGYTIEDDEMFNKVGMNSKRPSVGKTTKVNLELLKNGKPQKKMLHIQVYGMKNSYELNAYIN